MNQSSSAGGAGPPIARPRRGAANPGGALDPARLLEGLAAGVEPAPTGSAAQGQADERHRTSPARQVNAELRGDAGRIFANWVVRVTNLPQFRARPDLGLAEVKRGMPELVVAAIDALAMPDPVLAPDPNGAAAAAAVALARSRATHGFALGEVLTDVQELCHELSAAVWRAVDAAPGREDALRDLIDRALVLGGDLLIAVSHDWVARISDQPPPPASAAAAALSEARQ